MKHFIYLFTVLFLVFIVSGCGKTDSEDKTTQTEAPRPAYIVNVEQDGVAIRRVFPGTIEASNKVELAFRVGGQISQVHVQAGQLVKKDELVAQLDEAPYRNTFNERTARYELAKTQYDKVKKLLDQKLISRTQ